MATPNLNPNADTEGSVGTSGKRWGDLRAVLATIGTLVVSTAATITNLIATLKAGTTSQAPLTFTSGSNLTSPVAGAQEFDGIQFYGTANTTEGRGAFPLEQYFHLTADGSTISTIANFFGATSGISLASSAYYVIDVYMYFLKTTAGTVTWSLTYDNAVSSENINFEMSPVTGVVAVPGTATPLISHTVIDTSTTFSFATASLTSAVNHYAHFKIFVKTGASTTKLNIQATAGAGTITPRINSYWFARRISPNNIGTFN